MVPTPLVLESADQSQRSPAVNASQRAVNASQRTLRLSPPAKGGARRGLLNRILRYKGWPIAILACAAVIGAGYFLVRLREDRIEEEAAQPLPPTPRPPPQVAAPSPQTTNEPLAEEPPPPESPPEQSE